MDRHAYLNRLAQELSRWVPERERQNMLRYYEEYLDEAGPYQEQTVIAGLGDPAKLARALAEEAGFVPRKRRGGGLVALAIGVVIAVSFAVTVRVFSGFPIMMLRHDRYAVNDDGVWWIEGEQALPNSIVDLGQGADIEVDLPLGNVQICTGPVEQIYVDQNSPLGYEVVWRVKGNRLVVGAEEGAAGFLEDMSADVIITIPEYWELGEVNIDTELGDITLQGLLARELYLNTDLGNVQLFGTTADFLEAETGLGDVTVTEGLPLESELSTGAGNILITANCLPIDCGYELESGLGQVYVDGQDCGSESANSVDGPYRISGETGWGDIYLDFFGRGRSGRGQVAE